MVIKRLLNKDYKILSKYINKYYKKGHILSKNKKLFDWMYFDIKSKKYNFLVAKEKNKIIATKGFQPLRLHDGKLDHESFMSMWSSSQPTVGIKLFDKLLNKKFKFICGIGSSKHSLKYQKYKKFSTGQMKHSYLLSKKIQDYKIAKITKKKNTQKKDYFGKNYVTLDSNYLKKQNIHTLFKFQTPRKSLLYLINRYLNSKFYKYYAYGTLKKDKILNIIILRDCNYKNRIAVRVVDYIGSNYTFKYLDKLFKEILERRNVEYVDLYSYGIPEKEIVKSGFKVKNLNDKNIIPNHFEPFEKKNEQIIFGYLAKKMYKKKIRIFKGDSDMDRPNL